MGQIVEPSRFLGIVSLATPDLWPWIGAGMLLHLPLGRTPGAPVPTPTWLRMVAVVLWLVALPRWHALLGGSCARSKPVGLVQGLLLRRRVAHPMTTAPAGPDILWFAPRIHFSSRTSANP